MAKYGCRKCGVLLHEARSTQDNNASKPPRSFEPGETQSSTVKSLMIRCTKCGTLNTFVVPK